jgi:hypothetical protein
VITNSRYTKIEWLQTLHEGYSFFGKSYCDGLDLGIQYPFDVTDVRKAKKLLRQKFGTPSRDESGDGKVTFEYVFTSQRLPGIYFTVYDYKGCMSCGLGVPNDFTRNADIVKMINDELTNLIKYVYTPMEPLVENVKQVKGRRIKVNNESTNV